MIFLRVTGNNLYLTIGKEKEGKERVGREIGSKEEALILSEDHPDRQEQAK